MESLEKQIRALRGDNEDSFHKRRASDVVFSSKYRISIKNLSQSRKKRKMSNVSLIHRKSPKNCLKVVKKVNKRVIFDCTSKEMGETAKPAFSRLPSSIKADLFKILKRKLNQALPAIKKSATIMNSNKEKLYFNKQSYNRTKSIFSRRITYYTTHDD